MFERNHNLVPIAEAEECEVEIKGLGGSELNTLSFNDIKNWPDQKEVIMTLVCGGNKRRYLQQKFSNIKGLKWTTGAIANAKYKGVLVRDLLIQSGLTKEDQLKGKHLIARAMDTDF